MKIGYEWTLVVLYKNIGLTVLNFWLFQLCGIFDGLYFLYILSEDPLILPVIPDILDSQTANVKVFLSSLDPDWKTEN